MAHYCPRPQSQTNHLPATPPQPGTAISDCARKTMHTLVRHTFGGISGTTSSYLPSYQPGTVGEVLSQHKTSVLSMPQQEHAPPTGNTHSLTLPSTTTKNLTRTSCSTGLAKGAVALAVYSVMPGAGGASRFGFSTTAFGTSFFFPPFATPCEIHGFWGILSNPKGFVTTKCAHTHRPSLGLLQPAHPQARPGQLHCAFIQFHNTPCTSDRD